MKLFKNVSPSTKTEGMGILTPAVFFALTGNPAWFALLLAIVVIALVIHSLAARLSYHSRSSKRSTLRRAKQGKRQLKRLPRLAISARTPLAHPTKLDGHRTDAAAPVTSSGQNARRKGTGTTRTSIKRSRAAMAA